MARQLKAKVKAARAARRDHRDALHSLADELFDDMADELPALRPAQRVWALASEMGDRIDAMIPLPDPWERWDGLAATLICCPIAGAILRKAKRQGRL
jgi:hypothetical protein|tara:strand:- start:145 stop:438 length:294 start_codon:yes stop_codon:yes gene_type:complete